MSEWNFARRITHIAFSGAGTTEIASGEPIRIYGYTVSNIHASSTATVTLRSSDGNTNFAIHSLAANGNVVSDIRWIADQGLEFVAGGTAPGSIRVTVFHSQPGT